MKPVTSSIMKSIEQELRIPEINPDDCLHSYHSGHNCQACVSRCHKQAWLLDDESLSLDINACDGCGLCVPECPTGALHIHFPWVTRELGAKMVALFACQYSQIKQTEGLLPCIHMIGIRQLLQLYNNGIEHILISTGDCEHCSRNQKRGLYYRLHQLNQLLVERKKPPLYIMARKAKTWKSIFKRDETLSRGTRLNRRNFLQGGSKNLREQLFIVDPLNQSEMKTIAPGRLLPSSENTKQLNDLHWPYVPKINEQLCNGCDACIKLCPTQALTFQPVNSEFDQKYELDQIQTSYVINPQNCTDCGICKQVCESNAIEINHWAALSNKEIKLLTYTCKACGVDFHFPEQNPPVHDDLCHICQLHNHNSNLFQVL
jgi:ferredoxin